jgi:hypothetical protein
MFATPAFMLSGFAFPIRNMPIAVQYFTCLNPLRYFMESCAAFSLESRRNSDLVLISGDPVHNISDIRRCTLVIRNGAEYRSANLYAALGIRP